MSKDAWGQVGEGGEQFKDHGDADNWRSFVGQRIDCIALLLNWGQRIGLMENVNEERDKGALARVK